MQISRSPSEHIGVGTLMYVGDDAGVDRPEAAVLGRVVGASIGAAAAAAAFRPGADVVDRVIGALGLYVLAQAIATK